jgi:hypothetical protein
MAQQQHLLGEGGALAVGAGPANSTILLKASFKKTAALVAASKKDYFTGVKAVVVAADETTKIDTANRDADWSLARHVRLEMPCGVLLSALNPHRNLPAHVGSRNCPGRVCGGAAGLKRPAPAAAAAAAAAAAEAAEADFSDPAPAPKRCKEAGLERFMPTNHQAAKVSLQAAVQQGTVRATMLVLPAAADAGCCSQAVTHLTNFFFRRNVALQNIEDEDLKAAFRVLGVDIPGRKKLSGSLLDQKYTEVTPGNPQPEATLAQRKCYGWTRRLKYAPHGM